MCLACAAHVLRRRINGTIDVIICFLVKDLIKAVAFLQLIIGIVGIAENGNAFMMQLRKAISVTGVRCWAVHGQSLSIGCFVESWRR